MLFRAPFLPPFSLIFPPLFPLQALFTLPPLLSSSPPPFISADFEKAILRATRRIPGYSRSNSRNCTHDVTHAKADSRSDSQNDTWIGWKRQSQPKFTQCFLGCNVLLTSGSFLFTIELLCLQLCAGALLLTVGVFCLELIFCLQLELLCLQ